MEEASPEAKKHRKISKKIRISTIIAIFLVVFSIVFVGLYYFRVYPFDKVVLLGKNRLVSKSTYEELKKIKVVSLKKEDEAVEADVLSAVPHYNVSFADKGAFIQTLKQWGIYGRAYVKGNKKISKISIVLTDKPQSFFPITDETTKEVLAGSNAAIKDGQISVLVYIAPNALPNANRYFEREALRTLFALGYLNTAGKLEIQNNAFNVFLQKKAEKNQTFLKIEKK